MDSITLGFVVLLVAAAFFVGRASGRALERELADAKIVVAAPPPAPVIHFTPPTPTLPPMQTVQLVDASGSVQLVQMQHARFRIWHGGQAWDRDGMVGGVWSYRLTERETPRRVFQKAHS